MVDGAKLDTTRDGSNVGPNRKERNPDQHGPPTEETESVNESLSTFVLEIVPREQLPVVIHTRREVWIRVGVGGPDLIQTREWGGKEDISCCQPKTNRCSVKLTSAWGNCPDRIRR